MTKKYNPDRPLTDKELESMGPWMYGIEGLPKEAQIAVRNSMRGRPKEPDPKVSISIRLDADIVNKFRAHGAGWQTEINGVLRQWLDSRV